MSENAGTETLVDETTTPAQQVQQVQNVEAEPAQKDSEPPAVSAPDEEPVPTTVDVQTDTNTENKEEKTKTDSLSNQNSGKNDLLAQDDPTSNQEENKENTEIPQYLQEFVELQKKNGLKLTDFGSDPNGYLNAILKTYNVEHPKKVEENYDAKGITELTPWIEGVLEKMKPEKTVFGSTQYETRLFRLFHDALCWFPSTEGNVFVMIGEYIKNKKMEKELRRLSSGMSEDEVSKVKQELESKNKEFMKPLGVLPLSLITGINTKQKEIEQDMEKGVFNEDDLLTIILQIGTEGIIVLKCSDHLQRIKWLEHLTYAVFNVEKPIFMSKPGSWNITALTSEKKVADDSTSEAAATAAPAPVRMGTHLFLNLQKVPSENKQPEENTVELEKLSKPSTPVQTASTVPALGGKMSNAKTVL